MEQNIRSNWQKYGLYFIVLVLIMLVTNHFYLKRKPIDVNVDIVGNGVKNIEFNLGLRKQTQAVNLSVQDKINFRFENKYLSKNVHIKLTSPNLDYSKIELGVVTLRKGKIKLNDFSKYEVNGADKQIYSDKIVLSPKSKDVTLSYPVLIRPSLKFSPVPFLFFLFFPCIVFWYVNKHSKETIEFLQNFRMFILNDKKLTVLAIIFSVILTLLTPHWWIKRDYWREKYKLPIYSVFSVEFKDLKNISNMMPVKDLNILDTEKFYPAFLIKKKNNVEYAYISSSVILERVVRNYNGIWLKSLKDMDIIITIPKKRIKRHKIKGMI